MALNVLEIGYGSTARSAAHSGGELFTDVETRYFGLDLPNSRHHEKPSDLEEIRAVDAHWAALPYRDGAFGAVVMRSCFGQFMDSPQLWLSERWSLGFGLSEAARVLEPGGKLFISEENTPEDLDRIIPDIMEAGFDIDALETEVDLPTKEPNPAYHELRKQYFGDKVHGLSGGGWFNYRYVIQAIKPADRPFVVEIREAKTLLPHRDNSRAEWSNVDDDTELGFYIPADYDTHAAELRVAKKMKELFGDRYANWVERLEAEQE